MWPFFVHKIKGRGEDNKEKYTEYLNGKYIFLKYSENCLTSFSQWQVKQS